MELSVFFIWQSCKSLFEQVVVSQLIGIISGKSDESSAGRFDFVFVSKNIIVDFSLNLWNPLEIPLG